jgi:GNAT superfamily N-acetyltransferase
MTRRKCDRAVILGKAEKVEKHDAHLQNWKRRIMADAITFRAVSAENWADFETLFQKRGAPKSCWCTAWRKIRAELKDDPSAKKHEMQKRIRGGEPVGILGYVNGDPIAWCSVSPRDTYRSSMADALDGDEDEEIWSIVCFFVMGHFRGKGLFAQLIEAAETHAAQSGATVLEAYPVDPDSPSYRFGGFLPTFEELGYKKIGRKGARRYVVRKSIK